jgi:hypothetical protein
MIRTKGAVRDESGEAHHVVLDDDVRPRPVEDRLELALDVDRPVDQRLPGRQQERAELFNRRLAELGGGVTDEVRPELASRLFQLASAANTTRCPRRRSTSPMPMQLFVGP